MSKPNKKILTIDADKWLSQVSIPVTEQEGERYYLLELPVMDQIAMSPFVKNYLKRDENAVFDQMDYFLDDYYQFLDRHPGDPDQPIILLDFDNCFDRIPRVATATYKGKTILDHGQPDDWIKEQIDTLIKGEEEEKKIKEELLLKAEQDDFFCSYFERILTSSIPEIDQYNPLVSEIVDYKETEEEPIPIYGEEHLNIVDYRPLSDTEKTNITFYKVNIYKDYLERIQDIQETSEDDLNKIAQDTAMKYCIRQSSEERNEKACEEKTVASKLLNRLKEIFGHGFVLRIEDTEYSWNSYQSVYIPFDKSASMSRQSKMSFIEKQYAQGMNDRLMLGIDFGKMSVPLSKFYAYKGLYFSTAKRIAPEILGLDAETLVVLDDKVFDFRAEESKAYSAFVAKSRNEDAKEKISRTNEKFDFVQIEKTDPNHLQDTNDRFDGEGIMSCQMQELVINALGIDKNAVSFQIRLPFAKGMLHTVDFHKFLREYALVSEKDTYIVKDAFNKPRDLMKAKIILTKSMFKMYDWLKKWVGMYGSLLGDDPMEFYFRMLKEYKHSLYICRDDLSFQNGSLTSCNYQFLNTLHLSRDDYDQLYEQHKKYIVNPEDYISRVRENSNKDDENGEEGYFLNRDTLRDIELEMLEQNSETEESEENPSPLSEDMEEGGEESIEEKELSNGENDKAELSRNAWISFLKKCPNDLFRKRLLSDPYVQSQLKNMSYGRIKDIGIGKLMLPGEVRFLSRDLLCFLYGLIRLGEADPEGRDGEEYQEKKKQIENEFLAENQFDMPGNHISLQMGDYYPIFRNPHLSRCEQACVKCLIPRKNSVRSEYLGHLKGTFMVAITSFAPIILGGADFDGDIIKIYNQSAIRDSVLRNVYGMKGSYKKSQDYQRILPIVTNYSADKTMVKNAEVELFPDFEVLHNTFSNNIGKLSNLAAVIGFYEYRNSDKEFGFEMTCEKLNILVGIDIDAAKSGQRADLMEVTDQIQKSLEDEYKLSLRKAMNRSFVGGFVKKLRKKLAQRNYFNPGEILKETFVEKYTKEDVGGIESLFYLPYLFKDGLEAKYTSKETLGVPYAFMETDEKWSEALAGYSELHDKLQTIIKAYRDVFTWTRKASRHFKYETKGKYVGSAATVISRQGMTFPEAISCVEGLALNLYEVISNKSDFAAGSEFQDAIASLKDSQWPYLYHDPDKMAALKSVLKMDSIEEKVDKETFSYLFDFSNRGFLLLYLLLKIAGNIDKELHKGAFLKKYFEEKCNLEQVLNPADQSLYFYAANVKKLTDAYIRMADESVYEGNLFSPDVAEYFMQNMRNDLLKEFEAENAKRSEDMQISNHMQFMMIYQILEKNKLLEKGYMWELFSEKEMFEEIEGSIC